MLQVTLYNTSSDPRTLSKALTAIATVNVEIMDNNNTSKPILVLDNPQNYRGINYVFIPHFNRYYFASVEIVSGQLCNIHCDVDVLMSYAAGIRGTKVLLDRTAQKGRFNLYFADDKIRKYAYERTQAKYFPLSPLSRDGHCVLITAGGAPAAQGGE
jgi:hypothetical protein